MERKTGKEMAKFTEGLTGGGTILSDWFLAATISELHEYILNVQTGFNDNAYKLAITTLKIRIAENQSKSAANLEKQTDKLVNQTNTLVEFTRKLYLLTFALIAFAVIQIIVMLWHK